MRIHLAPLQGAERGRVLRRLDANFSGWNDPQALVVHDDDRSVVDNNGLLNGAVYHYMPFYLIGSTWEGANTISATPSAT